MDHQGWNSSWNLVALTSSIYPKIEQLFSHLATQQSCDQQPSYSQPTYLKGKNILS